jgi:hypothetical protein
MEILDMKFAGIPIWTLRVIASAIVVVGGVASTLTPASLHAQQQNLITLSCNGTSKLTATAAVDIKPDPITNLGIIVNVADRTVSFSDYITPVTGITATLVSFSGRQTPVP